MANSVETLFTAQMGMTTISTANPNLDGAGSISDIITGSTNGTFIKSLLVKAQTNTSEGMLRFFVSRNGADPVLLSETYIPPITKSGRDLSFSANIPLSYMLEEDEVLKVSTEQGDTFNIIAEAFDISYSSTAAYLGSTVQYIANAGADIVATANSNLDGSGALVNFFTAQSSGYSGCIVQSIMVKAQGSTTPGMIRFFVQPSGGGAKVLFWELRVPTVTRNSNLKSFQFEVIDSGGFCLPPGYSLWASTENAEPFSIVCSAKDWKYV